MNTFAAYGSIPGEVLPAIMEIEAVGAIASLCVNLSIRSTSLASEHAPFSSANFLETISACSRKYLNIFLFHCCAVTDSKGTILLCKNE